MSEKTPRLSTHHKFVKTTPNPNATKKSSGELVGPPPPLLLGGDVVAAGMFDDVGVGMLDDVD